MTTSVHIEIDIIIDKCRLALLPIDHPNKILNGDYIQHTRKSLNLAKKNLDELDAALALEECPSQTLNMNPIELARERLNRCNFINCREYSCAFNAIE